MFKTNTPKSYIGTISFLEIFNLLYTNRSIQFTDLMQYQSTLSPNMRGFEVFGMAIHIGLIFQNKCMIMKLYFILSQANQLTYCIV